MSTVKFRRGGSGPLHPACYPIQRGRDVLRAGWEQRGSWDSGGAAPHHRPRSPICLLTDTDHLWLRLGLGTRAGHIHAAAHRPSSSLGAASHRLPPAGRHLLHVVAQVCRGAQTDLSHGGGRREPRRGGVPRSSSCTLALQLSQLDSPGRGGAVVNADAGLLRSCVASPRRRLLKVKIREAERHDEMVPGLHGVFSIHLSSLLVQIAPVLPPGAVWRKQPFWLFTFWAAVSAKNTKETPAKSFTEVHLNLRVCGKPLTCEVLWVPHHEKH